MINLTCDTPARTGPRQAFPAPPELRRPARLPQMALQYNGRCIPDPNGIPIEECFLLVDEDILHTGTEFGHRSLLQQLQLGIKNKQNVNTIPDFFKKLHPIFITLIITITNITTFAKKKQYEKFNNYRNVWT